MKGLRFISLLFKTQDGKGIVIKQEEQFARNVLPKYFNHNKFCSFMRQLNLCKLIIWVKGGLVITSLWKNALVG